jgi:hypothetical protein
VSPAIGDIRNVGFGSVGQVPRRPTAQLVSGAGAAAAASARAAGFRRRQLAFVVRCLGCARALCLTGLNVMAQAPPPAAAQDLSDAERAWLAAHPVLEHRAAELLVEKHKAQAADRIKSAFLATLSTGAALGCPGRAGTAQGVQRGACPQTRRQDAATGSGQSRAARRYRAARDG